MKSINDAFKFESTIEEKENVFIPVNDKVKPRELISFILVGLILIILAILPVI